MDLSTHRSSAEDCSIRTELISDIEDNSEEEMCGQGSPEAPSPNGQEDQEQNEDDARKFTNFFMEEILKPEFGSRKATETKLFNYHGSCGGKDTELETSHDDNGSEDGEARDSSSEGSPQGGPLWPAWVYCTRYSDRPSSGKSRNRPRTRKSRKDRMSVEKRPRTAFTDQQLNRLKREFEANKYLTEDKRRDLARELNLKEVQIKIWFQNKRAKLKKAHGVRNGLAMQLMAQGLYNHSTVNGENYNLVSMEDT